VPGDLKPAMKNENRKLITVIVFLLTKYFWSDQRKNDAIDRAIHNHGE
jgi:hypothetical protein